jgi:CelD/BcsL family acetyltransferase involved in cellulose biosynthesis
MTVNYRLISPDELDATLMDAWRAIQSKSNIFASPYFCPEFTRLVAGVRDDVRVVVIEDAARPVGFFPHQRSFLGMGKPIGGPLSDYHGVIVEPDCEWDLDALLRAANLSVWTFDHLAGDVRKFGPHVTSRAPLAQIDLSGGYERYAQARRDAGSSYIKKTEGLARKLAREVGELRFTLHEAESGVMEQLIKWKREQYRRSNIVDTFCEEWPAELLNRIAHTQTAPFAGICSVLRVGDRIVAAHMGMRSRDTFHYWFPAYDPQFARFSTGIILLLRMAQALAGNPVRTIDLGIQDDQYKQRLMTGTGELLQGFVELPSLLARARQLQRAAEARAARGGLAAVLRLPLRAVRRLERLRKYR